MVEDAELKYCIVEEPTDIKPPVNATNVEVETPVKEVSCVNGNGEAPLNFVQSAEAMHPAAEAVATVQSITNAPLMAYREEVTVTPFVAEIVPVATFAKVFRPEK